MVCSGDFPLKARDGRDPSWATGQEVPEVGTFLPLPVAGCRMPDADARDAGCRIPDAGCRMPDAGYRIPDTGCRCPGWPDAGCRMPDAGLIHDYAASTAEDASQARRRRDRADIRGDLLATPLAAALARFALQAVWRVRIRDARRATRNR